MQTGEGKTLAAVAPVAVVAMAGAGAHVLTVNDDLARRDAEWMGPLYRLLGLEVAHVARGMGPGERRAAHGADVTCLTAKEAGFDLLRDLVALDPSDTVVEEPPRALQGRRPAPPRLHSARRPGDRRDR